MPTNSNSVNTTSDSNGTNVRPELQADSFFLLDLNNNSGSFSQTEGDQFGVISQTEFRTTSRFSSYTGKVFAICQGQVFVQPNASSSNKVNLVLKPFKQPINGLAIKYFVYRGLNKSDFFTNDGKVLAKGTATTEFINHIRGEFDTFNPEGPDFLSKYIGYETNVSLQNEADLIDDYFFKIADSEGTNGDSEKHLFEFPLIPKGTHLGNVEGGFGLDIVLNEGDYSVEEDPNPFKLNLAYARANDFSLKELSTHTDYQKKLLKESCTQFLDPAAFYGLHTQGKSKLFVNSKAEAIESAEATYGLIKNFKTANTVYLYIQSNRQRSYNFYKNYKHPDSVNNLKIGSAEANLTEQVFGQGGWPLLTFDNPEKLYLQLITDNNSAAALYVKQGILNTASPNEDNFVRNTNLLKDGSSTEDKNYTNSIIFDFVRKGTPSKTVSSFVQLIYEGSQQLLETETVSSDPDEPDEIVYHYLKDIDDVFGMINGKTHFKTGPENELNYLIDQNLLLINFPNTLGGNDIGTVTTKRVEDLVQKNEDEDLKRITYETLLNNVRQNVSTFTQSRSAYSDNSNIGTVHYDKGRNNFYQPEKPYYFETEVFTDFSGNTLTGLTLKVEDGTLPSKKILGITDDENQMYVDIIADQHINNAKFYFDNHLGDEEGYFSSPEDTEYRLYNLGIVGENQSGELVYIQPDDAVQVSTIDQLVFVSDEYAKWALIENVFVDNNMYETIKQ